MQALVGRAAALAGGAATSAGALTALSEAQVALAPDSAPADAVSAYAGTVAMLGGLSLATLSSVAKRVPLAYPTMAGIGLIGGTVVSEGVRDARHGESVARRSESLKHHFMDREIVGESALAALGMHAPEGRDGHFVISTIADVDGNGRVTGGERESVFIGDRRHALVEAIEDGYMIMLDQEAAEAVGEDEL